MDTTTPILLNRDCVFTRGSAPVVIIGSQARASSAVPRAFRVTYAHSDSDSDSDTGGGGGGGGGGGPECCCGVCLDDFRYASAGTVQLPCGHCFHLSCIRQWLTAADADGQAREGPGCCPYCRADVGKQAARLLCPFTAVNAFRLGFPRMFRANPALAGEAAYLAEFIMDNVDKFLFDGQVVHLSGESLMRMTRDHAELTRFVRVIDQLMSAVLTSFYRAIHLSGAFVQCPGNNILRE